MLESLIQFFNDYMSTFYYIIRKFMDYSHIKDSAIKLNDTFANQVNVALANNGYKLKNNQWCLLIRRGDNINMLILNDKNKLSKQIDVSIFEYQMFASISEETTYYITG